MKYDFGTVMQLLGIVLMLWAVSSNICDRLDAINNTLNKHPVCTCPVKP